MTSAILELPSERAGEDAPAIVLLHWLGGGAQTWRAVVSRLAARGLACLAFDLPGFGRAARDTRLTVAAAAEAVAASLAAVRPARPWLLVGHSMGGKVTSVLARMAADGDARLEGLTGLVLVSPSPPSAEPMSESRREALLRDLGRSTGSDEEDRRRAARFVTSNVGESPLSADSVDAAIDGVLAMDRDAWSAWLTHGSREDWATRVGRIPQAMLLLCGGAEEDLGEASARDLVSRHATGEVLPRVVVLAGVGHLAPLEEPAVVAEHIATFAASLGIPAHLPVTALQTDVANLLASSRTSPRTRAVLTARLAPLPALPSLAFDAPHLATLHALVDRVVPGAPPEIATRVARGLTEGTGDGWRLDALPADVTAWGRGLSTLDALAGARHGASFVELDVHRRDDVLRALERGTPAGRDSTTEISGADLFSSAEAIAWFMDARVEIVRTYMSDPRTLARVGFRGFADEGGFTRIRLGEREDFEP